jgi:hypothetical protein
VLEFFVHGALCVAYSGQCFISHAHTGRSANRGSCSQECRQPYTVTDAAGRIVAHDKHVLSLKDNDQSANLRALVDAGIRSFKIEGRYKDMATVKNVTAHYRQLLDALLEKRPTWRRQQRPRTRALLHARPRARLQPRRHRLLRQRPARTTSAPSTPPSTPACRWARWCGGQGPLRRASTDRAGVLNNGDALTWWDLQGELQGVPVNVAQALGAGAAGASSPTPPWPRR